jgi:hypothetical protein
VQEDRFHSCPAGSFFARARPIPNCTCGKSLKKALGEFSRIEARIEIPNRNSLAMLLAVPGRIIILGLFGGFLARTYVL